MSRATGLCPMPLNLAFPPPLARRISTWGSSSACAPARAVQAAPVQQPGLGKQSRAEPSGTNRAGNDGSLAHFPRLAWVRIAMLVSAGPPKLKAFAETHRAAAAAAECRRGSVAARQQHGFNPCIDGRTQRVCAVHHACDHASGLRSIAWLLHTSAGLLIL